MKQIIFLFTFIFFSTSLFSQNKILVNPGDSFLIAPFPKAVEEKIPMQLDYVKGLKSLLNSFRMEHITYRTIHPAYSVFGLANYYSLSILPYDEKDTTNQDSASLVKIRKVVFQHNGFLELIYNWAVPYYKDAFREMSVPEQNDYLALLEKTKSYAENFDLATENRDFNTADYDFTGKKGKLSAFVFRRIRNNELTKQECIDWLKRIIADFRSVLRTNPVEADNYVLYKELYGNYFLAAVYTDVRNRRRSKVIHVEKDKTTLLENVSFFEMTYEGYDLISGTKNKCDTCLDNSFLFYCDTSGYKILNPGYAVYGVNDMVLGEGENRRILIMQQPENEGSQMLCSVYDLDSSFSVVSNILLPVSPIQDMSNGEIYYQLMTSGNMLIYEDASLLYGVMNMDGRILIPAKYKSISAGKKDGEYVLDGKKHVILN